MIPSVLNSRGNGKDIFLFIVNVFNAVLRFIGVFKCTESTMLMHLGSINELVDPVSIKNFVALVCCKFIFIKGRDELCVAGVM